MKTVLHLNASSGGGAFVAAQRLSQALNKTGKIQSQHLVYTGIPGDYILWANNTMRRWTAFGLHAMEKLDFLRFEKNKELRFAFSHGLTGIDIASHPMVKAADIIHLHWINKGFISLNGLDKLLSSGKKIIWTAHDLWPFTGGCYHPRGCENFMQECGNCKYLKVPKKNDLSHGVFQRKAEIFSKNKITVLVPGKWSYDLATKSGLASNLNIVRVPNAIDSSVFVPSEEKKAPKDNGKLRLLFSSFNLLTFQKGLRDLAFALNSLDTTQLAKIELLLLGNAKENLPKLPCEVINPGIVHDTNELVQYYQSADLMVIPSYEETFGLTAIEAQACGVPVLAYNSGELAHNVLHEKTGWLCDTGDKNQLMVLLKQFLEMGAVERAIFSKNARTFASENFDLTQAAERHLALYEI